MPAVERLAGESWQLMLTVEADGVELAGCWRERLAGRWRHGKLRGLILTSSLNCALYFQHRQLNRACERSCMCVFSAAEAMQGPMLAVFNEQKCKQWGHAGAVQKATHQSHFQPAWMWRSVFCVCPLALVAQVAVHGAWSMVIW